ncbi:DUF3040 domain-containing protein [Pseudactinotalea terrae]|uniref:DUF3040 domain-containing protein n=1 Tax=Pseudactinotalea terrae TaxID=1743262 RepID=UPI0012E276E0|nr:DUF3040 domain-containing protein [Pseudactinotalea terrae]
MPLSEYEQRVLDEMEQQLRSDDPKLARTISGGAPRRPLHVALGGFVVIAGIGLLFAGLWNAQVWLGLIGFVAMFGGVLLALRRPKLSGAEPQDPSSDNVRPIRPKRGGGGKSGGAPFMQRLEERWDKRRRDER